MIDDRGPVCLAVRHRHKTCVCRPQQKSMSDTLRGCQYSVYSPLVHRWHEGPLSSRHLLLETQDSSHETTIVADRIPAVDPKENENSQVRFDV
jgi:hypothetical protein